MTLVVCLCLCLSLSHCVYVTLPADESSRRRLVSWLEDQIIRHLPIEDRCGLRNVDSNDYTVCVNDYLASIECPWKWNQHILCIDWLVNFALRLHYEDTQVDDDARKAQLNNQPTTVNDDKDDTSEKDASTMSTFLSLDWSTDDVTQAVDKLAESLNIACHPDRQVTLESLTRLLEKKEKKKLFENQCTETNQQTASKLMKGPGYTLHTAKLLSNTSQKETASTTGVAVTAEKVLRLIHLNQLRSLQNVVNDLTVTAQAITASPATNAALATKSEGKKIK